MCRSGQGTTVVVRQRRIVNKLSFYDDKDNEWVKSGFVLDPIIQSLSLSALERDRRKQRDYLEGRQVGRTHTAHY
jgi:hypothetical protein